MTTVNQEILVQDYFVFVILTVFYFSFFVPEPNVKVHFQVVFFFFLDSNENYMTVIIFFQNYGMSINCYDMLSMAAPILSS